MPKGTHLLKKTELFAISIAASIFLLYSDFVPTFLAIAREWELLAVFIAGTMFTSFLTVAPSMVLLGELIVESPESFWTIALVGGVGAAVADCFLLYFFKSQVQFHSVLPGEKKHYKRLRAFFHSTGWRWFGLIIGTLLIASPLPDEVGLALMGFTNVHPARLFPIALVMNVLGIYLIGIAALALTA